MTVLTPDLAIDSGQIGQIDKKEHEFPLRTVEGTQPVTIQVKREFLGWVRDPKELVTQVRLVHNPESPDSPFLFGSLIRGKRLLEPTDKLKDAYADQANRVAQVICLELLSNGDCHKTRLFDRVLTRSGHCFYGRGGRDVRAWILRLPDVKLEGKHRPCFVRVAACLAEDEPDIISSLCGVSIDEAKKIAKK